MFLCDIDVLYVFFFQAEDGIRDLVRSRGLGDVYKRQVRNLRSRRHFDAPDQLGSRLRREREAGLGRRGRALSLIHI